MTSIIFHQTQTREQKLAHLAQEITKAGSLAALFSKLSARHGPPSAHATAGPCHSEQRFHPQR